MTYGYCRCSTDETKQDINRQKRELKNLGCMDNTIYWEYCSATKLNRPELYKLLSVIKSGDTIVTTEISRITRSTKQLCDIIDIIQDKHLKLIIKDSITIDCTKKDIDPMTKAFIQISGVFAELERNMISERVKSGLRNARSKGKLVGRPKLKYQDIPKKVLDTYTLWKDGKITKVDYAKICNISRPTLDKYLDMISNI